MKKNKEIWSEMKIRLEWNNNDQYWMNPENLLLILRKACPNTEFRSQYLIHPSKDIKENTYQKILKKYLTFYSRYNILIMYI